MSVKVVTSWDTLMCKAKAVGDAKKTGDPQRIAGAEAKLEAYKEVCLKSDEIILPFRTGNLF